MRATAAEIRKAGGLAKWERKMLNAEPTSETPEQWVARRIAEQEAEKAADLEKRKAERKLKERQSNAKRYAAAKSKEPLEHEEQCAIMRWWNVAHTTFDLPESLLYAVPNGGQRTKAQAGKLKAEGVRAGIPDMCLAVKRGGFGALYVELKRRTQGGLTVVQASVMDTLTRQGYCVRMCRGSDQAIATIVDYLQGRITNGQAK